MSTLAVVVAVVALVAAGPADATVTYPRHYLWLTSAPPPSASALAQSCSLPCTCLRLSRWTSRMRAHCDVFWPDFPTADRQLFFDSSVDEVDFAHSKIHMLHIGRMTGMKHIKVIRMEGVDLSSLTNNAFHYLPNLWSLSLAHNNLTLLPQQIFLENHRLHYLSLRNNPLRVSPGQPLVTSSSLQALDLADCHITAVDRATFQQLPSLHQLHLERNLLSDLPADAVAPMAQLTRLFLESNNLLFFPSAAIKKLPQLLEVRLDNNTDMEGPLGPLEAPKLQRLTANRCSLQSVQPNLLATAPELRYLEVPYNQVRTLWFTKEPANAQLLLLDMTGNPLRCDCVLHDTFIWAANHVTESRVFCGEPPRSWQDAQFHQLSCNQMTPSTASTSVSTMSGWVGSTSTPADTTTCGSGSTCTAAGTTTGVGSSVGTATDATTGGGRRGAWAVALWMSVLLLAVLTVLGGVLLFVYRHEIIAHFFSPEVRAAASGGGDVMPLEQNHAQDEAISLPQ